MSENVLGARNFELVPTVKNVPLLLNAGDTPSIQSGPATSLPPPGVKGRLFLDTDSSMLYRDNELAWVQIAFGSPVYAGFTGYMSGSSVIPADNTPPLVTEGSLIWTFNVTPVTVNSRFKIAQSFMVDTNTSNRQVTFALFRDSVCFAASGVNIATSNRPQRMSVYAIDSTYPAAPATYSLRVGISGSGIWYLNGNPTINYGGIVNRSHWTVDELTSS